MMQPPAWVSRYIGIPYSDGARGPDAYDCWGLVRLVMFERFGVELPRFDTLLWEGYAASRELGMMVTDAAMQFDCIWSNSGNDRPDAQSLKPGDVLLMRVNAAPIHVGIVASTPWFIHTEVGQDSCIESIEGLRWSRRVYGVYRHECACETRDAPGR